MAAVALQQSSSPPPVAVTMGSPTRARNGVVVEGERKRLGIDGERIMGDGEEVEVEEEEEEDGGQLDLMG